MSWLDTGEDEDDGPDESDIRERPNPRGNRPRTKRRPAHADARTGLVLGVDRGRYAVLIDDGREQERMVVAARAREPRRSAIVTGDRVRVVGDTSGNEGTLARIVGVEPRTTLLRRSADDADTVERAIVANADRMLIVVSAADPPPRPRFVDRCLVAAFDAGIEPALVITKTDLADPAPIVSYVAALDVPVLTSRPDRLPLSELGARLPGHVTVLIGHSGVGKSTLVNALVPDAGRATGAVNDITGRGRHTSSSTVSLRYRSAEGSGWLIDTPGVRSFGLGHVDPSRILAAFDDLAEVARDCPRGCTHLPDARDCALTIAAETGQLGATGMARLDSLRRLLGALAVPDHGGG